MYVSVIWPTASAVHHFIEDLKDISSRACVSFVDAAFTTFTVGQVPSPQVTIWPCNSPSDKDITLSLCI
jgi:hypothetical protein